MNLSKNYFAIAATILFGLGILVSCSDDSSIASDTSDSTSEVVLSTADDLSYPIVDTNQSKCYDASVEITAPTSGQDYFGQDAQYSGYQPSYTDNEDGTVTDHVTGLMWSQSPDMNGDGSITASDKLSYDEAQSLLTTYNQAGYSDWRLPTIKELYSLIVFSGMDPSGYDSEDTSGLTPFIDTDYFEFAYGDTSSNERIIDSQYLTTTLYVDPAYEYDFGVNFADGRIKGYDMNFMQGDKTFFIIFVRGNKEYGVNKFVDNGDETISDTATGLMWAKSDNGEGVTWKDALAYAEGSELAGYTDWRLPNVKELQSIVDYTRSPATTDSPAINALFESTSIINELGEKDWPYIWSGTTHANYTDTPGDAASYVSFGRAMGYMTELLPPMVTQTSTSGEWMDVHGAGAQKSDPKEGDVTDYPTGNGPQGDAIRIYDYVRLVRNI
ncbi:MAG: DUF1566 domain-containing protein [Bacteroidaceae bacterium]